MQPHKPAWYRGRIVQVFAILPRGVGCETGTAKDAARAYLVGNIFELSPFGQQMSVGPAASVVPAHDDVFDRWLQRKQPVAVSGLWIVPGRLAVAQEGDPRQNVRTRPMPQGSLASAPLAYAVKLHGHWYSLTDFALIEAAVEGNLLRAVPGSPAGCSGTGWLEEGRKTR